MKCWRVVQWATAHENAESRKLDTLPWYKKPNKHDGLGYRQMVREKDALALYGAFVAVCDVASRGRKYMRGWVERNGLPLTPAEIAVMTGFEEKGMLRGFEFFAQIGWLREEEFAPQPAATPNASGESPNRAAATPNASGENPLRERRERRGEREIEGGKNNGDTCLAAGAGETKGDAATMGTRVAASKAQFSALQARITELEAREDRLKLEERQELQELQKKRRELQQRQAAGKF